jgi:uncharacterized repeat protein (TIGR03803 family)
MTRASWRENCAVFVTRIGMAILMGAIFAAAPIAASAQAFTNLVTFDGANGAGPLGLTQGDDGNLYGTTLRGEPKWDGTAFQMTPSGQLTTLLIFCERPHTTACKEGASPSGGLVLAPNGLLYGVTDRGGANNYGTIYEINTAGKIRTLYNFCSQSGCADGASPAGNLVQSFQGDFYGTTMGTLDGVATIFKLTPEGTLTTLYSGCELGCGQPGGPSGNLIQGSDRNFYGTSFFGGANGYGAIFKITPSGTLTILYSFCALSNCADGNYPVAGLVEDTNGDLYGTTTSGGSTDYGTAFRFSPDGTLTTLHNFCLDNDYPTCSDGAKPNAPLILASDGNLYGTASTGGTNACIVINCGTLFQITKGGEFSTVYDFTYASSFFPGTIVQGTDGIIYGAATETVTSGTDGGIFSVSLNLPPFVEAIPSGGSVRRTISIVGQGLTGTTSVSINEVPTSFTVVSDTLIHATVPANATTGYVAVSTPTGTLTSNVPFHVIP